MDNPEIKLESSQRRTGRQLSLRQPVCCPPGCYLSRNQIEAVAEGWAERSAQRDDPDWLEHLIGVLGGDLRPAADPGGLLLVAERLDCFAIAGPDQWSMAEGLGHLVLHIAHVEPPPDHAPGRPVALAVPASIGPGGPLARARMEAVWFAAAFLMPEGAFRGVWRAVNGNLRRAAAALGMPMGMVAARAVRLGLS